jgi:hypothetical protein
MLAVASAAPMLAGEAARRADAALAAKKPALPVDLAEARGAFANLMSGVWPPARDWA